MENKDQNQNKPKETFNIPQKEKPQADKGSGIKPPTGKDPMSILNKLSRKKVKETRKVIYGVYDNRNASFWAKIDDFMIDHTPVKLKEKAYFFHLLAVMINAGVPVLESLQNLADKSDNEHFKRIINTLVYTVERGYTFSDALSRFPEVFTEAEIGVIKAGEAAGNLDTMLKRLSEDLDKKHELHLKLITASTYPLMVLGVLVLVGIIMISWVVPLLVGLLTEGGLSDSELPLPTKILLGFSDFITGYWWAAAFVILMIYGMYKFYRGTSYGKFMTDYWKLKIPIVGSMTRKVLVLQFISLLGILVEAGVPLIKVLQIIAGSIGNEMYKLKIWEVSEHVARGERISKNLYNTPFLFPVVISRMLETGEKTANVSAIAQKIAEHYDKEIDHSLKRMISLFEPLMMLVVAVIVALMALAILMPIFNLTSLV